MHDKNLKLVKQNVDLWIRKNKQQNHIQMYGIWHTASLKTGEKDSTNTGPLSVTAQYKERKQRQINRSDK